MRSLLIALTAVAAAGNWRRVWRWRTRAGGMRRSERVGVLVPLILLALLPFSASARGPAKVLFIGDSITAALEVNEADRYPERVGALTGVEAVNLGCPGATSRDWEPGRVGPWCAIHGAWGARVEPNLPADALVVMLGTNDAIGFFDFWPNTGEASWWTPPQEYLGRLLEIVEAFEGRVFLVTPPPLAPWMDPVSRDRVERYRDAVFQVVKLHPRACLGADAWSLLSHSDGDFKNELHPNQQGLEKLARAMALIIERHVVRRAPCRKRGNRLGWNR